MKTSIFKKAEQLKDKIVEDGRTEDRLFITFKDLENPPLITLHKTDKYTYLESCSCSHHSIHGGTFNMKSLCAYILACYKVLK